MKINLIIPPDPFLGDDKRNPPLGLLYLAAVARAAKHNIEITDLRGRRDPTENLINTSEVYGFTSSTPSYYNVLNLARILKARDKSSTLILGGIHATSLPQKIGLEFDKVVLGEGEQSFLQILEDIKNGTNREKRFYSSSPIEDLDSIPFPARDLVPFDSAFSQNAFSVGGEYAGTIITTRGCPSQCSFCGSQTMWGRKVRFRSPDNVIAELKEVINTYKVKYFRFQDDTMVLRKRRLEELCKKIEPLGIHWRATTRVDCADSESLKLMRLAGCDEVGYGIESLDQGVLNINRKGTTLSQIYKAMDSTHNAGLKLRLFFIIGLPGEKPGFSKRLEEFLDRVNPEGVDVSTMVPYPGSPIYHNPSNWGIELKPFEFEKYHMTLGLREGEINRPLTFKHNVMSEGEIQREREESLKIILARRQVKNL